MPMQSDSFEVVDSQGRIRAVFGMHQPDDQPHMILFDPQGRPRIHIGLRAPDSLPLITLYDNAGNARTL